ncbi:hypothetical protein RR46_06717 [Papilio xuthus]|uniref:Uncharacterized protein n=1 Tax=Papilio xuthus TaxID=66420 RepID=A0A194PLF4_PAPXU|nr:hypothetical protein RR46_06717 [Papilio xuthus]
MIKLLMELVYKAMRHNIQDDMFDIDVSWNSELMNFFIYIFLMTSVHYHIKFLEKTTTKPTTTIIKIQTEVNDNIEEKTEQPIAEEKVDQPPAYALV